MIVIRDTFQAKYGQVDQLLAAMKEMEGRFQGSGLHRMRIMTDRSGPFFTLVTEYEVESLGKWEQEFGRLMSDRSWQATFANSAQYIESGRREFFHLEAEMG